ncbi:type II secretion system F family protein [soil metagenome]
MHIKSEIFKYLFIGFAAIALFLLVYAIVSAPTRIASRLGLRGLKRQRAVEEPGSWQTIEPLVRWLGVRLSGVLPDEYRNKMEEQITLAGDFLGITTDEYLAITILSGFAGVGVGIGLGIYADNMIIPLILGPIGAISPYMQITGAAQDRQKAVSRGLPYVVDLMALAMGAGLDFPGAVRQVVEKSSNPNDPIVEEFTLILQTINLGRTRKEVLIDFQRRVPVEVVKEFCGALIQAEERGNPVADVLLIQAGSSRTRRSVRAEELAAKAGVAMVGPLVMVFGTVMLLILTPMMMKLQNMN